MQLLSPTQKTLLHILSDGLCHSGNELGQTLGITRSAIWKHINQLIELGLPIISFPQQGYVLKEQFILLNEDSINSQLQRRAFAPSFKLHLFAHINSTNTYLTNLPFNQVLDICCAEAQTQGKGRFNRHWLSPFGENIYCSSRWNLNCDVSKLSGLSLIASLAIVASLKEFMPTEEIKIKWPNDILWKGKKLCGTLIEIQAESNANTQVILGVGINVNTDTQSKPLEGKPWCSMYEIANQFYDRNLIIASLLYHLNDYLSRFLVHDLELFMDEWQHFDYLYGQSIQVTQALKTISGKACGIDSKGYLILMDEQGTHHVLSSGDTSLQNVRPGHSEAPRTG